MRIKKLQIGGVAPFKTYTPNVAVPEESAGTQQATEKTDKKENEGLLSKEMMKLIMEEGIPSDVDQFMNQVSQFGSDIFGGANSLDSTQMYNVLLPQLNKIKYNKQLLEKTRKQLYDNGGFNEVAITTNGGVVAKSEDGSVNVISISEYSKEPNKYQLLSNNELDQMRSYDKNLAFNNNIVGILQNGQGINNVTKELQTVINQMEVESQQKQGFTTPDKVEVLKGLDELKGIVKSNVKVDSSRKYKEHAKEYLYNMLPQNSKNLLEVKAAQRGISAKDMMELLIIPSTKESISEEMSIGDIPGSKGSGSSGSSATRDVNFLDQWVGNKFDKGFTTHEFNYGDGYSMMVPSQKINGFMSAKEQKVLPVNSSLATIANEAFATIGDAGNIYFGNEKVPYERLKDIVSTGKSNSKAYMPLDLKALEKGEYKPNLVVADKLKVVADRIKTEKPANETEKYLIYKEEGIDEYYGDVVSNPYFAPFAVINAVAQGEGFVNGSNQEFFKKVEDRDEDKIKRILIEGNTGREMKKGDDKLLYGGVWDWMTKDTDFYEGLAFIHTPDNQRAASAAGNYLTVPKSFGDYQTIQQKEAENERDSKRAKAIISTNILNE